MNSHRRCVCATSSMRVREEKKCDYYVIILAPISFLRFSSIPTIRRRIPQAHTLNCHLAYKFDQFDIHILFDFEFAGIRFFSLIFLFVVLFKLPNAL